MATDGGGQAESGSGPVKAVAVSEPAPGILLVRLNRPAVLNAMNAEMIQGLHDVLDRVRADAAVRVLVLTGAGRAFSAGFDLRGYGRPPHGDDEGVPQAGLRVQKHIAELAEGFRSLRQPVIAAVNGVAAGGGMSLSLFAEIRVMAETAELKPSFVKIGLPGGELGISWLLPRMIGFPRAAEILLTGRAIGATEALGLGLVASLHPADQVLDAALDLAAVIAENSPFGVWMTKEVLWANLENPSFRTAVELENRTQVLASMTEDHAEGCAAFLEKRAPVYRNR